MGTEITETHKDQPSDWTRLFLQPVHNEPFEKSTKKAMNSIDLPDDLSLRFSKLQCQFWVDPDASQAITT